MSTALDLDPRQAPPPLTFALPGLQGLGFGFLLLVLALLLQPAIPAPISRHLRLALFLPVAALACVTPLWWRFEPFDLAIPANFRWAIFAPYGVLKAVQWGLLSDRARAKDLAWVGFDGREEERSRDVVVEREEAEKGRAHELASTTARSEPAAEGLRKRAPPELSAPTPRRPSTALSPDIALPSSSPTDISHLPTPSPSPPFDAVNPPSIASAPHPTSSVSPLAHAQRDAQSAAQQHDPLRTLVDATHLVSSLRGVGYLWGPPLRSLARPAPSHAAFVRRALAQFVLAHAVSTACVALQVLDRDGELAPVLARAVPLLSPGAAQLVSATIARLGIGASLHAQMNIGAEGVSLGLYAAHRALNAVLDRVGGGKAVKWRSTFDVREYPPLFDRPFAAMGEGGLAGFWGHRWHALFRDVFTSVGYRPVSRLARRVGLPKKAGQFAAVVAVFALSAWMHWQALVSARYALSPSSSSLAFAAAHHLPLSSLYPAPYASLSFVERHGTWVFFLAQPFAVSLEGAWSALTRRRVGGWAGKAWVALWVVGLGQASVGRSWLALGLVHGLPPVRLWSNSRFLLPVLNLAPMPLFMRSPPY
ncbi:hypothetical protein JCM3775_001566 [Rhodotorula graminis]